MYAGLISHASVVEAISQLNAFNSSLSLLATATESDSSPLAFAGILASLVVIYLASTIGAEICARLNLPPVLGQLLGGLVVGISAFHLLVFPEGGGDGDTSLLITFLKATAGLSLDGVARTFQTDSEVISILSEIGVVILLFEIGLELDSSCHHPPMEYSGLSFPLKLA